MPLFSSLRKRSKASSDLLAPLTGGVTLRLADGSGADGSGAGGNGAGGNGADGSAADGSSADGSGADGNGAGGSAAGGSGAEESYENTRRINHLNVFRVIYLVIFHHPNQDLKNGS